MFYGAGDIPDKAIWTPRYSEKNRLQLRGAGWGGGGEAQAGRDVYVWLSLTGAVYGRSQQYIAKQLYTNCEKWRLQRGSKYESGLTTVTPAKSACPSLSFLIHQMGITVYVCEDTAFSKSFTLEYNSSLEGM